MGYRSEDREYDRQQEHEQWMHDVRSYLSEIAELLESIDEKLAALPMKGDANPPVDEQ